MPPILRPARSMFKDGALATFPNKETQEACEVSIGIDPGKTGAVVVLCGSFVYPFRRSSDTDKALWYFIQSWSTSRAFACIELVGGYVGDKQPGSAMFVFGAEYGKVCAFTLAAGIPHELIRPQAWQKALGIRPKKKTETRDQFKKRLRQFAEQLFPKVTVVRETADALLIAEYCRRKTLGLLK